VEACPRSRRIPAAIACLATIGLSAGAQAAGVDVTPADPEAVVLQLDRRVVTAHADGILEEVDRLQYRHRFADAERLLDQWLAARPRDGNARLQRSQLRIAQGNARGALADCLQGAPWLDALSASACESQALGALGQTARARQLIETALSRAQHDAPALAWAQGIAAELAAREGAVEVAEAWHRRAVAQRNAGHFARIAYAEFLLARARPREVLKLLASTPDDETVMSLRRRAIQGLED
jgi:tetratricopeptide (TPR) repeat protein